MKLLANMHPVSVLVILIILALFTVSLAMLLVVCQTYRRQTKLAVTGDTYRSRVMHDALQDFTTAYKTFGPDTNTPAIVSSAITNNLHTYLMFERFLSNAVSLFVTMGLLGTFLGLYQYFNMREKIEPVKHIWSNLVAGKSGVGPITQFPCVIS